jgi:glycine cleavage system H protein
MLADEPEKANEEPYEAAWFFKIKVSEESEVDALLSAEQYEGECD